MGKYVQVKTIICTVRNLKYVQNIISTMYIPSSSLQRFALLYFRVPNKRVALLNVQAGML